MLSELAIRRVAGGSELKMQTTKENFYQDVVVQPFQKRMAPGAETHLLACADTTDL
jgi:hypothetical protein